MLFFVYVDFFILCFSLIDSIVVGVCKKWFGFAGNLGDNGIDVVGDK